MTILTEPGNDPLVGDQYNGFTCTKPDRGYGGGYSTFRRLPQWDCDLCGMYFVGYDSWVQRSIDNHIAQGHAPCAFCGKMLLCRLDGKPRQHNHLYCPGKDAGLKIEREFVKNMTAREFV